MGSACSKFISPLPPFDLLISTQDCIFNYVCLKLDVEKMVLVGSIRAA